MFDDFTIMYPGEWLSVYAVVAIQAYCYSQTNLWFLELVSVVF